MWSMAMYAEREGRRPGRLFGVLRRSSTYLSLLYLLLSFPLGGLYAYIFLVLAASAFSYGGLVALAFLVAYLWGGSWLLAIFERFLARWLLRVDFTPMAPAVIGNPSLWERTKAHLRNAVTWKSLLYLFIRLPFGFFALALVSVLLSVSLALLLAPILYVVATEAYGTGVLTSLLGTYSPELHTVLTQIYTGGRIESAVLVISLLLTVLGVFALIGSLHVFNGIASAWGWFAQAMLGMSLKDVQLAEARALTAEAQARAEQAEQGRRQLILDASHELRTPVATIRAHIDSLLLLEGEHLPEKVRTYLGITQREAERLGLLVDDLLMLARADADELRLDIRPIAVEQVVEEVFQALEPLAEHERQVTLVRQVAEGIPLAYADRDRLAQVLLNLVRNAITYTPAGGLVSIDLALDEEPGMLSLSVTDTGIGIAEDDLEHVFERFYRTDASRARHTGGSGLGLSIARDLVQAMGGALVAEHVPAGGSRFRVTLRIAA
jgi:two-component system, OmpR family, phosphate regulon sensor histidine kinase PhoR